MFFNKNKKPKLDPKVRYQNRQFNQKLQQARTFKREARIVPDSSVDKFLYRIGLGNKWLQALVLLVILGLGYIVYAPNLLTLQSISIEGASDSDRGVIEASIRNVIGNAPFYNPQHNMLFLSKNRVQQATFDIPGVDSVAHIRRDFKTKTLHVSVLSKYEKFLVRNNNRVFDIYNDGFTKGEAGVNAQSWETTKNPNMIKVDVQADITNIDNKKFFTNNAVQYMHELQENIKGIIGTSLSYVQLSRAEIEPINSQVDDNEADPSEEILEEEVVSTPEKDATESPQQQIELPITPGQIDLIMQKGTDQNKTFRVIADTAESPHDLVQRLNLLLSQTDATRYNNLSYIDLRVKSRAYICLINTVCD